MTTHELDNAKIGDGATRNGYSDRQAGTIIARTAKTITWQRDKATLLNGVNSGEADALKFSPGGFCGHTSGRQRWAYESDPNGQVVKLSRRVLRSGEVVWKECGWRTKSPGGTFSAGRHEYYDYNF